MTRHGASAMSTTRLCAREAVAAGPGADARAIWPGAHLRPARRARTILPVAGVDRRLREAAAQRERLVAELHVPLDADGVDALGDRVDLEREVGEQARERQLAEELGAHERRVELQRVAERLAPAAHGVRPEQQVLVHAVLGEARRRRLGVARVERPVEAADRLAGLSGCEHVARLAGRSGGGTRDGGNPPPPSPPARPPPGGGAGVCRREEDGARAATRSGSRRRRRRRRARRRGAGEDRDEGGPPHCSGSSGKSLDAIGNGHSLLSSARRTAAIDMGAPPPPRSHPPPPPTPAAPAPADPEAGGDDGARQARHHRRRARSRSEPTAAGGGEGHRRALKAFTADEAAHHPRDGRRARLRLTTAVAKQLAEGEEVIASWPTLMCSEYNFQYERTVVPPSAALYPASASRRRKAPR